MCQKITGVTTLANSRIAKLHWYQYLEVGKVEFKVKRFIKLGPSEPHTLDEGKEYEVISEEYGWYRIVDKSGEDYQYPKEEFKIVEDK